MVKKILKKMEDEMAVKNFLAVVSITAGYIAILLYYLKHSN